MGTKGTALLEEDTLTLRTYAPDTETYRRTADCTERQQLTETTTTEQFAPQAEPYPEMLANFADAILHGTPLTAPGVEGVRALELTDAPTCPRGWGRRSLCRWTQNGLNRSCKNIFRRNRQMAKLRFIVVGSGWRSLFYWRIAQALPERFELCAMLCRTEEKAEKCTGSTACR